MQGGGAHGAFTWDVLNALLEDGRLNFEGVSGTSAGAMNAVVLANGLMTGGRDGARVALEIFWTTVVGSLPFEVAVPSLDGQNVNLVPAFKLMLQWSHYFSPHQLNPFDLNPLKDILCAQIDFERLRTHSPLKLFIAATNANSGKVRLFRSPEISADAILASACLPTMPGLSRSTENLTGMGASRQPGRISAVLRMHKQRYPDGAADAPEAQGRAAHCPGDQGPGAGAGHSMPPFCGRCACLRMRASMRVNPCFASGILSGVLPG